MAERLRSGRFSISKSFRFEAAPSLGADHKCTQLHGHSYRVEVEARRFSELMPPPPHPPSRPFDTAQTEITPQMTATAGSAAVVLAELDATLTGREGQPSAGWAIRLGDALVTTMTARCRRGRLISVEGLNGVGMTHLNIRLTRLHHRRRSTYLEACGVRNRDLYPRHGYQLRPGVPFQLPDGGPPLWPMWREPQPGHGRGEEA